MPTGNTAIVDNGCAANWWGEAGRLLGASQSAGAWGKACSLLLSPWGYQAHSSSDVIPAML